MKYGSSVRGGSCVKTTFQVLVVTQGGAGGAAQVWHRRAVAGDGGTRQRLPITVGEHTPQGLAPGHQEPCRPLEALRRQDQLVLAHRPVRQHRPEVIAAGGELRGCRHAAIVHRDLTMDTATGETHPRRPLPGHQGGADRAVVLGADQQDLQAWHRRSCRQPHAVGKMCRASCAEQVHGEARVL